MALARRFRDQFDWPLFLVTCAIATLGLINLYSATSTSAFYAEKHIQQMLWLTLGTGIAVLVTAIDYRYFERYGWAIYGGGLVLLVLVFLIGSRIRGSMRWIPIGSFSLQPSELMKLGIIIALAKYLHNDLKTDGRTLKDLVIPGLILAVPMLLILLQPDLGTALICAFVFGSIMVLTQLKLRSLVVLAAVFVASAPITWQYVLQDYQKNRILALSAEWSNEPAHMLREHRHHLKQSLTAIGSGGVKGQGFMQGTQSQFARLPDRHSDFPFAVWAEEQGLWGALLVLGLYLFLILWALRIASQAKDRFGAVVAVGIAALIFWQTVINLGMVTGLLPVVGMTLPLFSYGGSSVLTLMIGIGLLMNISMRRFSV